MRLLAGIILLIAYTTGYTQVFSLDLDLSHHDKNSKDRALNGEDILSAMHHKYKHAVCKSYRFDQKNTHYRNDSIVGHSEWHEAIEFPDKFRIDFGDKANGNFVIFRNDSSFSYRKGIRVKSKSDTNTLLLLLGGMYYRPIDDVIVRLRQAGYHTLTLSVQTWKDQPMYVIGAAEGTLEANQIWIDQKTHAIVRIIENMSETDWMDIRFESHQTLCKGMIENKVVFYRNGCLEQVEEYYNITPEDTIPASTFQLK